MKKWIILAAGLLAALTAQADERSRALLDGLIRKLAGQPFEVVFTASMPGEFEDVEGRIVVSGDKYYVHVHESEVFYDGTVQQTYNADDNEVIIDTPDPDDNFILASPSRFFRFAESDFAHRYAGARTVGGKQFEEVVLTPQAAAGYTSISLLIDPVTGMPVRVTSVMEGITTPVEIHIRRLNTGVDAPASRFTFDHRKHRGVEVIDFR